MQEIKKFVEQLEESAAQLDKRTPTGGRLALMLADNLAELLLYNKARFITHPKNGATGRKYTEIQRRQILEHFKDKVNLLISGGNLLGPDEGKVLKIGHLIRNEAYHRGVLRARIIMPLAAVYLETVAGLLPRLWLGSWMIPPHLDIAQFLGQYGITATWMSREVLADIGRSVLKGRGCPVADLCQALSQDLVDNLDELESSIDHLRDGWNTRPSAEQFLTEFQFNQFFSEKFAFPETDEGFQQFVKTREQELARYKPPITMKTIARWRDRAVVLAAESKPGSSLSKYWDIDGEMLPIRDLITDAVYEYDEWINIQAHDSGLI